MKIIKVWGHTIMFALSLLMAGQVLASPETGANPDAGYLELFDGKCRLPIRETTYHISGADIDERCRNFSVDDPFRLTGVRSAVSIRITTHTNLDAPYAINLRTIQDNVNTRDMTYRQLMGAAVGRPYLPGLKYEGVGNEPYNRFIKKIRIELNK